MAELTHQTPARRSEISVNLGMIAFAATLVILPFLLPNAFYFDVAIRIAFNAIVVIGMNLLIGYTGQISLGQAAFFGIGAYTSGLLCNHFGWNAIAAMAAGMSLTAVIALVVGKPILRLRGHYLAMATLGLVFIFNLIIINETRWTGGPDGMALSADLGLFGYRLTGNTAWYIVGAGLLFAVVVAAQNLVNSPAGRALQAISGSEIAAQVSGIDIASFKLKVFILSAVLASAAGSFSAHYTAFLTPELSSINISIEFLTMVVVGGMASIFGSVVGAALMTLLPQLLAGFAGWQTVAHGVILVVFMIALPKGIVPSLATLFSKWRAR